MEGVDRTRRVGELIKRELAVLIARELNDKRIRMVNVIAVDISRDFKNSTIYVSCIEENKSQSVVDALNKASGYLRYLLGRQLSMRSTPILTFKLDTTIRRGVVLSNLIEELASKNQGGTSSK